MTLDGIYHATYYVPSIHAAARLLSDMEATVASSFGAGDEQWSGLDLTDEGATFTVSRVRDIDTIARVRIDVRIPVTGVEPNYWLSPYCADAHVVDTYDAAGKHTRGEAADWGMTFPEGHPSPEDCSECGEPFNDADAPASGLCGECSATD